MIARFVGGTEDGTTRVIPHGSRYYLVPLPPTTGSIEDFLNLDYEPEYKTQFYRRTAYDHDTHTATYTYERTE